ncbi:MAG: phosphoglycerate dehydrogenase [Chloroflexi bacterium]|nr:phosphoglycerate dehydrogenase [Chloroflexota bacterium]
MRVLVADPIAHEGIDLLKHAGLDVDIVLGLKEPALLERIPAYDALIVRSETRVTAAVIDAGRKLQVVGRAGVGVDNIDVQAATRRGVLVVNAPTSNIIAAAEHSIALMLALARHVPQANASLKGGKWARTQYVGAELQGKTLGIFGLGKVGTAVARRAKSFEMRIVAHDPFVSADFAKVLGVELVSKEHLLREADFISIHVPMTTGTANLISRDDLKTVKPSVRIINAARGGLVDEQALFDAVEAGKVAGAAVDTFTTEPAMDNPLFKSHKIIVTPHLGASTEEAQTKVAVEVAEQVISVLRGRPAQFAVNAPMVLPEALAVLTPFVDVAQRLGKVAVQLAEGQMQSTVIRYTGEIARYDTKYLKASVIGGLLALISDERVNVVNADLIAEQRGMKIVEEKDAHDGGTYRNMLSVELVTSAGSTVVAGTVSLGQPHITQVDRYRVDVRMAEGWMLLIENQDRPGMIGAVGTVCGKNDVNISFMEVGRLERRGHAMMVLGVDEQVPDAALDAIRAIPGIIRVLQVRV